MGRFSSIEDLAEVTKNTSEITSHNTQQPFRPSE